MTLHLNEVKNVIEAIHLKIKAVIQENFVGCYVHGSYVLGGFNEGSDIDLIVITKSPLTLPVKKQLAALFLSISNEPFPIEVTFLHEAQLKIWKHPSSYDFHYSEFWREQFTADLMNNTNKAINEEPKTDPDLAAHFTILLHKGICIQGASVQKVIPTIPNEDYLNAILNDYTECLEQIDQKPIYSTLNLLRIFLYVKEGKIYSKREAGIWGVGNLPHELSETVKSVLNGYENNIKDIYISKDALARFKQYIIRNIN